MGNFKFARKLLDDSLIEEFLTDTLDFKDYSEEQVKSIRQAEVQINYHEKGGLYESGTYFHQKSRSKLYRDEEERVKLRKQIIDELQNLKRLENDDDIKLGFGGGLPLTQIRKNKEAFLIIGLPASGKSTIASKLADATGSIIADADFAKRKFPEFASERHLGPYLVHKEASAILFGEPNLKNHKTLIDICYENNYNLVIPRIGSDVNDIADFASTLKKYYKYRVHLILVNLDRRKATLRAFHRFTETGRYVPLSYIFDGYGNEPIITYYRLLLLKTKIFESFCEISTDVDRGKEFNIIHVTPKSPFYKK